MDSIKLMIGTNSVAFEQMKRQKFKPLTWMSDNMETVAHYFEGCAVEIEVELDPTQKFEYAACMEDLSVPISQYGWGSVEPKCPKNATWYSFSDHYLKTHIKGICEIFPDLSPWVDPDDAIFEAEFQSLIHAVFVEKTMTAEEAATQVRMSTEVFLTISESFGQFE